VPCEIKVEDLALPPLFFFHMHVDNKSKFHDLKYGCVLFTTANFWVVVWPFPVVASFTDFDQGGVLCETV
jgi:hypothetical protein